LMPGPKTERSEDCGAEKNYGRTEEWISKRPCPIPFLLKSIKEKHRKVQFLSLHRTGRSKSRIHTTWRRKRKTPRTRTDREAPEDKTLLIQNEDVQI
jgi:hypothetical protein